MSKLRNSFIKLANMQKKADNDEQIGGGIPNASIGQQDFIDAFNSGNVRDAVSKGTALKNTPLLQRLAKQQGADLAKMDINQLFDLVSDTKGLYSNYTNANKNTSTQSDSPVSRSKLKDEADAKARADMLTAGGQYGAGILGGGAIGAGIGYGVDGKAGAITGGAIGAGAGALGTAAYRNKDAIKALIAKLVAPSAEAPKI